MKTKMLKNTGIKFIIVGLFNTAIGYLIMFCFYNIFHFSYFVSTASNYFLTSILSFFLNKYFTFNNKKNIVKHIFKFILNIVVCYTISFLLSRYIILTFFYFLETVYQDNIAMFLGMIFFTIFNYIGQKYYIFK